MHGSSEPRSAMLRGGTDRLDPRDVLAPPHHVVVHLLSRTAALIFSIVLAVVADGNAIPQAHSETPDISPRAPENRTIVRGAKSNTTTRR